MLLNLLLLLAATQQLPPINVTVQQPPGWPVWVTTLFSAAVGAILGFLGTLASDWWKGMKKKKSVSKHLAGEVTDNLRAIDAILLVIVPDVPHERDDWKHYISASTRNIRSDRHQSYFDDHKEMVYELDSGQMLGNFYTACREIQNTVRNLPHDQLANLCKNARGYGVAYLGARRLAYEKNGPPYDEVLAVVGQQKISPSSEPLIDGRNP